MANLKYMDSMDAYQSSADIATSKRWLYTIFVSPTGGFISSSSMSWDATGGRYGGACLTVKAPSISSTTAVTTSYMPVPTLQGGNYNTSFPTWATLGNTIQMGFWFRAVGNLTNATITLLAQSNGGTASSIINGTVGVSTTALLTVTAPTQASAILPILTLNSIGAGVPMVSANCPVYVYDGNWHWIELRIAMTTVTSVTSSATVYVDQNLVLDTTVPTRVASNSYAGIFLAGAALANQAGSFDDLYVSQFATGTAYQFPFGPRRMQCLRPNANGDFIQSTPVGAADNFAAVNQGYSNVTSYVQLTDLNQMDTYKFPALPFVPLTVNAVSTTVFGGNFESGTVIGMAPVLRSNGVNVVGDRVTLPPLVFQGFQQTFELDPNNNPWTPSVINQIQFGFETMA